MIIIENKKAPQKGYFPLTVVLLFVSFYLFYAALILSSLTLDFFIYLIAIITVTNSLAGTVNHIPLSPKIIGKIIIKTTIKS